MLTPRRSPSPPPAADGAALGPPARPAPASPETEVRPRSRSRSPERPKTAALLYGPRSRLPERPRSASPVGRNPYSPRGRNSIEAGWNPCFNHVVVKNKPLDRQPHGPPPPEKPKAVRLDGVPQHLHPGSRRAAETAKKIKKYRRQRRRIAAAAEGARRGTQERAAPWEASFAYPRGDSANRNAPRKQARPATAQPARPAADAAKKRRRRPALAVADSASITIRAGSSPIRSASSRLAASGGRATTWPTRRTRTGAKLAKPPASVRRSTRRSPAKWRQHRFALHSQHVPRATFTPSANCERDGQAGRRRERRDRLAVIDYVGASAQPRGTSRAVPGRLDEERAFLPGARGEFAGLDGRGASP